MLSVTDSALEHLRDAMNQAEDSESCFRMIARDDNTVGLILQRPATGDKTFEYEGATVLAMPETLAEPLESSPSFHYLMGRVHQRRGEPAEAQS